MLLTMSLPRGLLIPLAACALNLFVCSAQLLQADEPQPAAAAGEDMIALFDGKTLDGWEEVQYASSGEIDVQDGAIRLQQGAPLTSLVWKGEEIPRVNYELTMEARKIVGSDFFATVTFPVKENSCSFILGGWGGGLVGLSSINGADASENETSDYLFFEKERWYNVRIRVTDTHIQAWIDDKQFANVDYTNKRISVRIEMERCKPLGLSSYLTTGEVRKLEMKKIPPSPESQQAQE